MGRRRLFRQLALAMFPIFLACGPLALADTPADDLWEAAVGTHDPRLRIARLSEFIATHLDDDRVPKAITEILALAEQVDLRISAGPLDLLDEALKIRPIRPQWHTAAIRASIVYSERQSPYSDPSVRLIYIHMLELLIDQVGPFEYYLRYDFVDRFDFEYLHLIGLHPPVTPEIDLPFLKAVRDPVTEEPIQAQLLIEVAREYEAIGLLSEARIYYERYLKQYWPRYCSIDVQVHIRERLDRRQFVDPFYLMQPALDAFAGWAK